MTRQKMGGLTFPERREPKAKDCSYVPVHRTTKDALLQAEHRFIDKPWHKEQLNFFIWVTGEQETPKTRHLAAQVLTYGKGAAFDCNQTVMSWSTVIMTVSAQRNFGEFCKLFPLKFHNMNMACCTCYTRTKSLPWGNLQNSLANFFISKSLWTVI